MFHDQWKGNWIVYIYLVMNEYIAETEVILVTLSVDSAINEYLTNTEANSINVWKDDNWVAEYGNMQREQKTDHEDVKIKLEHKIQ